MIYLLYLVLVPISLLITLVAVILAPVLPLFGVHKDWWLDNHSKFAMGFVLPSWLNWFNTPDNDLRGDYTFQRINGSGYWQCVKWLWRNPAYSFALKYINTIENRPSYIGNESIKDNDQAVAGWCFVQCAGLFQFTWVKPIGFNRCIYCVFGWNIRGTLHQPTTESYQATFVFSPRISGFRP